MRAHLLALLLLSSAVLLPFAAPVASAGPCDNDVELLLCLTIEYAQAVIEIILRIVGNITIKGDPALLA